MFIVRRQNKEGVVGDGRSQDAPDEEEDEIAELEQRMMSSNLPEHALKAAKRELKVQLILSTCMFNVCMFNVCMCVCVCVN